MWWGIAAGLGLLGFVIWRLSSILVGESQLQTRDQQAAFPLVSGYNLQREEYQFPGDFGGQLNLLLVPFQRRQQQDVNTWIPRAQALERSYPEVVYYELPTIYQLPRLSRTLINEGMRAGIPDRKARERTITLYVDKDVFKSALAIETEQEIQLFLVDREGKILWREQGVFSEEKLQRLIEVIQRAIG